MHVFVCANLTALVAKDGADERDNEQEDGRHNDDDDDNEDNDGEDNDGDDLRQIALMEEQVNAVMEKLEQQIRRLVDAEEKVENLSAAVAELTNEEQQAISAQENRERARQRRQRQQTRHETEDGEDSDEHEPGQGPDDFDSDGSASGREAQEQRLQHPPLQRLNEKLKQRQADWEGRTLTEKLVCQKHGLYTFVFLSAWLTTSLVLFADTPLTIPTLGTTVLFMMPNTLEMKCRRYHIRRRGFPKLKDQPALPTPQRLLPAIGTARTGTLAC